MHLQGHARLLCGWASAVGRLLTSTASPTQSALWASQTLGQLRYISTPADSALHSMGLEPWIGYQAGIEKVGSPLLCFAYNAELGMSACQGGKQGVIIHAGVPFLIW